MNEQVETYIETYPAAIVEMFKELRRMIYDSTEVDVVESLWAKLPSYYAGKAFVRLIPFKDHMNIEAQAVIHHKEALTGYRITPKGMLQVFVNQPLPTKVLIQIFSETLI